MLSHSLEATFARSDEESGSDSDACLKHWVSSLRQDLEVNGRQASMLDFEVL